MITHKFTRGELTDIVDALKIVERSSFSHRFPTAPDLIRVLTAKLDDHRRASITPHTQPPMFGRPPYDRLLDPDTEVRR